MKGVENMSLTPLSLMRVKLTKKIKLFGKISGSSEKEPRMFIQNFKRKASEGRCVGK
jgi:hypothetical protein